MEKLKNKKDFNFPHLCLVGMVEFFFFIWLKREMGE